MKILDKELDPHQPVEWIELIIGVVVVGLLVVLKYAKDAAGPWAVWPRVVQSVSATFGILWLIQLAYGQWRKRQAISTVK
jgi:MFS superfamily sulfate permease-like transporter